MLTPRKPSARAICAVTAALAIAIAGAPRPARAAGIPRWTTDGVPVCTATSNQQNPQVAMDGAGGAIITWQDRRGNGFEDVYAQRLRADGTVAPGWPANGVALCTASFNQTVPQVASDGAGGAIVTWQDGRAGGSTDIYAQHVLAGGKVDPAWAANGVALCNASGPQGAPQIVSDGAGGAIVTWQDSRNSSTDIYAQRVLADGNVDPAWPADGVALCVANRTQSNPRIASDGAGGAIVTWHDARGSGSSTEIYDIYAQRVRATGVVDPAWPANGVAVCAFGSTQLFPQIVPDGSGGAIITWFDRRFGQPIDPILQDICAQRVNAAGVPQWTPDGVLICRATETQTGQVIAPDGAGGAIIAWQDFRSNGSYDIYAQHVRADSTISPGWPVNGVAVCTTSGSQENPQIATDGAGGVIITWYNVISPPSFGPVYRDVYAQRVRGDGTIPAGWPAAGIVLCAADSIQQIPQIVSDGAGGAIVAWQDARGGGTNPHDIYAQRINDSACQAVAGRSAMAGPCDVVEWTQAKGGPFFDIVNWNRAAGPVPSGTCPANCSLYDARFGMGGAAYGVSFAAEASSGMVTVQSGDHPTLQLAGNTYRVSGLHLDGAGSGLTISGGTVALDGAIQIGSSADAPAGRAAREAEDLEIRGAAAAGVPAQCSFRVTGAGGSAVLSGAAFPDSIVFAPGAALISAAPVSHDLTNAGTLSPGSQPDGVGKLESGASFTQLAGGTLAVDLGGDAPGTGFDVVRVSGAARLAGRLEWKLVGGYVPAIGKQFEVLVAHPRIGTFDSVAEDIAVSYTDTSVVLIATPATPVLASLVSAVAEPGRVRLRWHVSDVAGAVTVRRDRGTGAWELVVVTFADGSGVVTYEDLDVMPGRFGYRLGLPSESGEIAAGEVWVDVPVAARFGLAGVRPNPAPGPLNVSFSLGSHEPASLDLLDMSGRRVESRAIDSPRPGNRVLALGANRELPAGVYVVRLSQGALRASSRVAVVR